VGRPCTICVHPQRAEIEAATTGVGEGAIKRVARRFEVGRMALQRHWTARHVDAVSSPAQGGGQPSRFPETGTAPVPVAPAAVVVPDAVAARIEALRRLVRAGDWDATSIGRLAAGMGISSGEVWLLLQQAALAAASEELPPSLAREQSIDFARRVRKQADDAGDSKGALAAQAHIDSILIPRGKPAGDVVPRAELVARLRQVALAVQPWPDAFAAVRAVLGGEATA